MSSLIAKVVSVQNDAREPSAHVVGIVFESGEPEPGATALSDFGAGGLPLKGLSRFVPNKRYYLVTDGVPITVGDRLCVKYISEGTDQLRKHGEDALSDRVKSLRFDVKAQAVVD